MKRTLLALALLLAITLGLVVPALAAGLYDGLWFVVESHPGLGVTSYYISIHQNDAGFALYGFNVFFTTFHIGNFFPRIGAAVLSGNVASGNLFDQNIVFIGTTHVTFTDSAHLTGTFTYPVIGTSILVGERAF